MVQKEISSVAVIVPCLNEIDFIENCIKDLLDQRDIPPDFKILVIDGMSNDGTRDALKRLATNNQNIVLLDNPERIAAAALNLGISSSYSDIVIRIDAHSRIPRDFIRNSIDLLREHPEAWIVGGPVIHRGRNNFAKGVAIAMSSLFGNGGARHRDEQYEGYAEGAAFPAIRRWVFDCIGLFDTEMARNEDDEFFFRVTRSFGKIYISPRIRYEYYVRERPKDLWLQLVQYGYWKVPLMLKHRRPIALRHLIPAVFVAGMIVSILFFFLLPHIKIVATLPILLYLVSIIAFGISKIVKGNSVLISLSASLSAVIMHFAYGFGCLIAILMPKRNSDSLLSIMKKLTR